MTTIRKDSVTTMTTIAENNAEKVEKVTVTINKSGRVHRGQAQEVGAEVEVTIVQAARLQAKGVIG